MKIAKRSKYLANSMGPKSTNNKLRKMWEGQWLREFYKMRDWLDENDDRRVDDRTERLGKSDEDSLIKIAILDSGCDSQLQAKLTRGKVAAGWKDFVNEGSIQWVDNSGHGTVVVSILIQIVKYAKIYVARVFDSKQADSGTAKRVARVS